MLLTFSDFVAFKEMFLDFRAVSTCLLLYITHIIRAPSTRYCYHTINNYYDAVCTLTQLPDAWDK